MKMNTPKSEIPKIEYKQSEDIAEFYANNVVFQSSLWDMKILFGELYQSAGPNAVTQHSAVTLPWAQVKLMVYFLQLHLMGYEAVHGRIVIPKGIVPEFPKDPPKDFIQQSVKPEDAGKYWGQARKFYEEFLVANPEAK